MNPVDLTHGENDKRKVSVGQPEETRKAEFWLDSLKTRGNQCFG